jgi:hypothetical protein
MLCQSTTSVGKALPPLASMSTNNAVTRYCKRRLSEQGFTGVSVPASIEIAVSLALHPLRYGRLRCLDAGQLNAERLTRLTHPDHGPITSREDGGTNDGLDADG